MKFTTITMQYTYTSATLSAPSFYSRAQAAVPSNELTTRTLHNSVSHNCYLPVLLILHSFSTFPSALSVQYFPHATLLYRLFHTSTPHLRGFIYSDPLHEFYTILRKKSDTAIFAHSRITGRKFLSEIYIYIGCTVS
jgi:hypothetical protein